jgi:hypothetical protein
MLVNLVYFTNTPYIAKICSSPMARRATINHTVSVICSFFSLSI